MIRSSEETGADTERWSRTELDLITEMLDQVAADALLADGPGMWESAPFAALLAMAERQLQRAAHPVPASIRQALLRIRHA